MGFVVGRLFSKRKEIDHPPAVGIPACGVGGEEGLDDPSVVEEREHKPFIASGLKALAHISVGRIGGSPCCGEKAPTLLHPQAEPRLPIELPSRAIFETNDSFKQCRPDSYAIGGFSSEMKMDRGFRLRIGKDEFIFLQDSVKKVLSVLEPQISCDEDSAGRGKARV